MENNTNSDADERLEALQEAWAERGIIATKGHGEDILLIDPVLIIAEHPQDHADRWESNWQWAQGWGYQSISHYADSWIGLPVLPTIWDYASLDAAENATMEITAWEKYDAAKQTEAKKLAHRLRQAVTGRDEDAYAMCETDSRDRIVETVVTATSVFVSVTGYRPTISDGELVGQEETTWAATIDANFSQSDLAWERRQWA